MEDLIIYRGIILDNKSGDVDYGEMGYLWRNKLVDYFGGKYLWFC